ncbi:MAG: hypothetical protein RUMPE_01338 [Eubacteriales bacterium SKADARSKE-1]|nr:hypothetical protein [Eubacteriales bacterium SKADARSKE-1]
MNGIFNTISGLPGRMLDIGKNLVQGLWDGINGAFDWLKEKVGGFVQGIQDFFTGKQGFDTHSPSKWAKEVIGENIALGIGEGFALGMPDVTKDIQAAIPTDFSTDLNAAVSYTNSTGDLTAQKNRNSGGLEAIATAFAVNSQKDSGLLQDLLNETRSMNDNLYNKFVAALVDGVNVSVDNRELARLVKRYAPA